jgi:hypothetical protein
MPHDEDYLTSPRRPKTRQSGAQRLDSTECGEVPNGVVTSGASRNTHMSASKRVLIESAPAANVKWCARRV